MIVTSDVCEQITY